MENINLLRKIAWSFHKTTGMDWDDLFQEAAYAYCISMEDYKPEKGALSTHVWSCILNHLRNYLKEEMKQHGHLEYYESLELALPNMSTNHPTFLDSLTMDAREIAKLVFSTPKKFVVLNIEEAEQRVIRIMLKNGWDCNRVVSALINLETVCSTE
jgi:hypothetical protein